MKNPPRADAAARPVTLPLYAAACVPRLQALVRAMGMSLGLEWHQAFELAAGAADLAAALLLRTPRGGKAELKPVAGEGRQGLEVSLEDDGQSSWAREEGRSSADEYEVSATTDGGTKVTARTWGPRPHHSVGL